MENNQKYIKIKCSSEHDYEAIFNYCKKNFPNIKVKAKPKKLVIRVPLSTNGDRAAEEMDLFVDAINTFVCPEDKVKYKLKTYTKEHTGTSQNQDDIKNNQKYLYIKSNNSIDYEKVKAFLENQHYSIIPNEAKNTIKFPFPTDYRDDQAEEAARIFISNICALSGITKENVSFKLKTYHIVPEKTQSVTMAHFSGGTETPEDNVGYSFHDTIADEIFQGAMLRGESPLVALHELEKRTNLMAIRAAFDGADEFTTDMSDYEREEDYGL